MFINRMPTNLLYNTLQDEAEAEPLDRREQRRQDRAEQRQAEAAARDARANKINAYEDKRRKKEEEREARERAQVSSSWPLQCRCVVMFTTVLHWT